MAEWVRLCGANEVPAPGEVAEIETAGRMVCLANVNGELHVLDNVCPHRQGPLGQGWVEGNAVLCPWHAWAFDVTTGTCDEPEHATVKVFPVKREGDAYLADLA